MQRGAAVERAAAALAARRAAGARPPTGAQLAAAAGLACGVAVEEALREGWAARQRLVDCNRPLVFYMAAKLRGLGLALEVRAVVSCVCFCLRVRSSTWRGRNAVRARCVLHKRAAQCCPFPLPHTRRLPVRAFTACPPA